jgi:hypothetical protein
MRGRQTQELRHAEVVRVALMVALTQGGAVREFVMHVVRVKFELGHRSMIVARMHLLKCSKARLQWHPKE